VKYGRYRHTPLVSYKLADSLDGLLSYECITIDMETAARKVPLSFNPHQYTLLYSRDYWFGVPDDERQTAAEQVDRCFEGWYGGRSEPVEKAFLALVSLTHSHDYFDNMVDRIIDRLKELYTLEITDHDESHFEIADYHAVRDPANIRKLIQEDPRISHWCKMVGKQVRRTVLAPPMPIEALRRWHLASRVRETAVREYFGDNAFLQSGITPKKARKIIAKSYNFACRFFGRAEVLKLIHGDEVRIDAPAYTWGLTTRPKELIANTINPSNTHTPFTISLYDKEGDKLCGGCVLWPGTPVLDQLVAFHLCTINEQEEAHLLEKINLFRWTEKGLALEALAHKHKPNEPVWPEPEETEAETEDWGTAAVVENPTAPETVQVEEWVTEIDEDDEDDEEINEVDEAINQIAAWQNRDQDHLDRLPEFVGNTDSDDDQYLYFQYGDRDELHWVYRTYATRRASWRQRRRHNGQAELVKQMLIEHIEGPAEIIELMADPGAEVWIGHDGIPNLPEHIERYITEKELC
jgi:hypothetical protein